MINQTVLLSFIIPIYNVEKYLEECFNSISSQVDFSCEIILVDDGATDSSGAIADRLKLDCKTTTVKVVHKKNGGLASARNAGLDVAEGKYVAFVDSDDRLANSLSEVVACVKEREFDLCFMQGEKFFLDGSRQDMGDEIFAENIDGKSREEIFKFLSTRVKFAGSSCTKIFSKKFLDENNLRFPDDKRLSEDLGFVRDAILKSQKYMALDCPYYEYRQGRADSITHDKAIKRFDGVLRFVEESVTLLADNKKPKDYFSKCFLNFVSYEYTILMYLSAQLNKKDFESLKNKLKGYKWTLKYGKGKKTKIIRLLTYIMPIKWVCKIIKFVKK
jgi:glycosyltransferase involved in cell wall biosynthesis